MQMLLSRVRRCVEDYDMIKSGDRIAVGVSAGKDSLSLLWALANLRRFYPQPFELEAVTIDMGFDGMDMSGVGEFCEKLGVRYTVIKTQIKQIVFDIRDESNPCSLCAKLRRGALNDAALSLGCGKVALGHHFDDAVETFLLCLLFEGRLSCFTPVTFLDRRSITAIRPLLYAEESMLRSAARELSLPVVKSTCPKNGGTKRQEVKELALELEARYPDLRKKIFTSMQGLPLGGWDPLPPRKREKSRPENPEF